MINITDKQLRKVIRECLSVDQVLKVIRHEYSDYDAQWKAGRDYQEVRKAFGMAFAKRMAEGDPANTKQYIQIAVNWIKQK